MRGLVVAMSLIVGAAIEMHGKSFLNGKLQTQLERLFPTATDFSPKQPTPPHFKAYATTPSGERTLLGVAFWTTELDPLERGYDGPIKILVGMNMNGVLTGVVVAEHHEPYGYFSIDRKQFSGQFIGKNIRDPFTVGADVDGVSRASISIASATRAIRNSARQVARQLLLPPAVPSPTAK
jgi:NosR/NirI family nitrous oxide reductase transcriptional regulator